MRVVHMDAGIRTEWLVCPARTLPGCLGPGPWRSVAAPAAVPPAAQHGKLALQVTTHGASQRGMSGNGADNQDCE